MKYSVFGSLFFCLFFFSFAAEQKKGCIVSGGYGFTKKKKSDSIPFSQMRLAVVQDLFVWTCGSDDIKQWSLDEKDGKPKEIFKHPRTVKSSEPKRFAVSPNNQSAVTSYPGFLLEKSNLLNKSNETFRFPKVNYSDEASPVAIDEQGTIFAGKDNKVHIITDFSSQFTEQLSASILDKFKVVDVAYKKDVGLGVYYQAQDKLKSLVALWNIVTKQIVLKTEQFNYNALLLPNHFDFDLNKIVVQSGFKSITIFTKKNSTQADTKSCTFDFDLENQSTQQLNQLVAPTLLEGNNVAFYHANPGQNKCKPAIVTFSFDEEQKKILSQLRLTPEREIPYDFNTSQNARIQLLYSPEKKLLNCISNGGFAYFNLLALKEEIEKEIEGFHEIGDDNLEDDFVLMENQ